MHKQEKNYIAAPSSTVVSNFMYILETSAVKASETRSNKIHSAENDQIDFPYLQPFYFKHFEGVLI